MAYLLCDAYGSSSSARKKGRHEHNIIIKTINMFIRIHDTANPRNPRPSVRILYIYQYTPTHSSGRLRHVPNSFGKHPPLNVSQHYTRTPLSYHYTVPTRRSLHFALFFHIYQGPSCPRRYRAVIEKTIVTTTSLRPGHASTLLIVLHLSKVSECTHKSL